MGQIPILGEDLDSAENRRVREYNGIVHAVAKQRNLPILPLYDRLVELLPRPSTATPFDGSKRWMLWAMIQHFVLRRAWDSVSAIHGLTLLTDHVHLNDRGANVMATLVEDFITGSCNDATDRKGWMAS